MENTIIDDDATIVADAPASSKAPATAVSRKEILPAFCITVVAAIALYALMSYVQPLLMNNNFIYDFGTMMTGCIEGSPLYRVAWFFADLTEGSFIAALPASIGMIIMGFVAAALERKKSAHAGTGVAVSNADPALRAAAHFVVCSNDEDAVRACLERFFGR